MHNQLLFIDRVLHFLATGFKSIGTKISKFFEQCSFLFHRYWKNDDQENVSFIEFQLIKKQFTFCSIKGSGSVLNTAGLWKDV